MLHVRERFDPGRRIVVDQDIVHGEAGTGEKIQVDRAQVHGAVERCFERSLNARAKTIGAHSWRGQAERRTTRTTTTRSGRHNFFMGAVLLDSA